MGFMPLAAIDPSTHLIALEVVFSYSETYTTSVPLRLDRTEFELQARLADPARAAAGLRQWVVGQALRQLASEQPELRTKRPVRATIYWLNGRPARREPFLR
jgi:hypothetical protein